MDPDGSIANKIYFESYLGQLMEQEENIKCYYADAYQEAVSAPIDSLAFITRLPGYHVPPVILLPDLCLKYLILPRLLPSPMQNEPLSWKKNVCYRNSLLHSYETLERECPVGAIRADDPTVTDNAACISCMRCIAVCPQKARSVSKVNTAVAFVGMVPRQNYFSRSGAFLHLPPNLPCKI